MARSRNNPHCGMDARRALFRSDEKQAHVNDDQRVEHFERGRKFSSEEGLFVEQRQQTTAQNERADEAGPTQGFYPAHYPKFHAQDLMALARHEQPIV
jgi:hypothetical protein